MMDVERFGGIARLYGVAPAERLTAARVAVVGIGGVGSWAAEALARRGIAVRAGLHCAPYAHESAGTLETGTVRVSMGYDTFEEEITTFLRAVMKLPRFSD